MKALLAVIATALVLVTAAWGANVTPSQLARLAHQVTLLNRQISTLRHQTAALQRELAATNAQLAATETREGDLATSVTSDEQWRQQCLNAFAPAAIYNITAEAPGGSELTWSDYGQPTGQGTDQVRFYLPEVPASCVQGG